MTILVAIDGGEASERALETAVRLGRGLGESLYVAHLVDDPLPDVEAERLVDDVNRRLRDEGVAYDVALENVNRWALRPGTRVGEAILEIAADVEITHVVLGHDVGGVVAELLAGSAARTVAEHADVPVTIVTARG